MSSGQETGRLIQAMMRSWPWLIGKGAFSLTLDKDFGELAVVHGQPHAGILRLVILSAAHQAPACLMAINRYGAELQSGAIVTVELGRVRIRPATPNPQT